MNPQRERESSTGSAAPRVSTGYSYYVLGVLFVVYVFNFIDRQVLSILLDDIKKDIGVSDTYMGFLTGFAFVVFYTFAGIPIAHLADRTSRRTIIALGLIVWTSMTAASGLARNALELVLARIGVGVGEAAGSPPAHSLLSDYFSPERRATVLSIYATGVYVGVMIAFLAGGYISEHFGWRSVYLTLGLAGIPLALLVRLSVRELPRGYSESTPVEVETVAFSEALRLLLKCRSLVWIIFASSVQSISGYAFLVWGPAFLGRVHEMGRVDIGIWLGLIVGIAGSGGAYLGGRLTDWLGARDQRWYMRLPAIESACGVPFVIGFVLLENQLAALLCFIPFYLLGAMYVGPMLSTTQSLVSPSMRATTSAVLLFVLNMIGLGLGPLIVGHLNDRWSDHFGIEAIRYSLLLVGILGGLASVLFWQASRGLREDLRAARAGPQEDE
jgi:MFS family permease